VRTILHTEWNERLTSACDMSPPFQRLLGADDFAEWPPARWRCTSDAAGKPETGLQSCKPQQPQCYLWATGITSTGTVHLAGSSLNHTEHGALQPCRSGVMLEENLSDPPFRPYSGALPQTVVQVLGPTPKGLSSTCEIFVA
jgi:hypothetical protein